MPSDQPPLNPAWPVLRAYRGEHLRRVAMPLGGIGTGTVSLGGRGNLRDWEIVNRPAKGFVPKVPVTRNMTEPRAFFAARVQAQDQPPVTRLLEGDLDPVDFEGTLGSPAPHHGLPRFAHASFHAAYPLAQLCLSDPDVPVALRLEAFNPLIPGRADDSGLPIAVFRWVAFQPVGRARAGLDLRRPGQLHRHRRTRRRAEAQRQPLAHGERPPRPGHALRRRARPRRAVGHAGPHRPRRPRPDRHRPHRLARHPLG